ncbi:Crp/Fnr family transcriptional regulator [Mucilaginibacter xinganensis]|uniref:Cyclic nucleotide-binding protein n=1 Tax=Mucilaginibacter xinganensis TaxID=1234841 RepID=A0A223NVN2_9SPHI|nr:cyclic nucleotide-binding domain-containing protein [Mucilaginibacter xinganensis]ASU33949.1 cyclic nucleotide-binding protein [Mucilaginibacter xinganensis]
MFTRLLNYLSKQSTIPLSPEDIRLIEKAFVPKKFKKKQFLLKAGDVCKYICFIEKGATRQYTIDEKGNEHVLNLSIENWWTSDRESFHKFIPSIYNIDAWEETDVLMLPKVNGWYDKVNAIPAFGEMRKRLDDAHHIAMQRRLLTSINYAAEYRYEELMIKYPEFIKRFPQHIIASYLGISKETLSRIRNKALKNRAL